VTDFRSLRLTYLRRLSIPDNNISDVWSSLAGAPPHFPELCNNALQALYHAVRLDLGIIRPNQIYNSPVRFNASISNIYPNGNRGANGARMQRDTVGYVDLSKSPKRVPRILYLTSVMKQKPLGQAITAVFVATFTMLSAVWKVGSFITSSFVGSRSKQGQHKPSPPVRFIDTFAQQSIVPVPLANILTTNTDYAKVLTTNTTQLTILNMLKVV
jgi:hypothetical protein